MGAEAVVSRIRDKMMIGRDIDLEAYADVDESAYLKPARDYEEDVWEHMNRTPAEKGALLPWSKTHADIQLRRSAMYLWSGPRKQGKSLVTGEVMNSLMAQGEKVVIAPTEMDVRDTLERMERQVLAANPPTRNAHADFYRWAEGKLWLYETPDGVSPAKRMLGLCRYAIEEIGATQVLIDSLMMVRFSPRSSFEKNEQQIDFARSLVGIAKSTGATIHLVAHHKKQDGSSGSDKIKGAGDLPDLASGNFEIQANTRKQAEANKPIPNPGVMDEADLWLKVENQRYGPSGGNFSLWLDQRTLKLLPSRSAPVRPLIG